MPFGFFNGASYAQVGALLAAGRTASATPPATSDNMPAWRTGNYAGQPVVQFLLQERYEGMQCESDSWDDVFEIYGTLHAKHITTVFGYEPAHGGGAAAQQPVIN
ncbi:uncharacterized protein MONBRDRAFT_5031 [Monosiga brevicollis MX1]|uniref:Uncharacterized protein n=1 Tax=Monosiga brevicollis TaxID=81824 RepID=A9UPP9_MONBE|nr:uncharacterized protein MONBRDRAFT_5031 [Monosiga brevicollis MX1]EDQ92462.1 predicted protein [Monosiga brevicollis MX1]|eukprot:XP_001742224.1 hypothetical protein [Monosiga brevicollis MX1]